MPDAFPVHSIVRHEGRIWTASPHGYMARQSETGAWEDVGTLLACHKSPVWSAEDGKSFTPIACPALAEPGAYLHLAVPDGHGGVLVSGFNGLLIRVSPEGGLGSWENAKPAKKAAAKKKEIAPNAAAKTKDPAVEAKLLAEIHAARDDDAPRLVYADWLTEHRDARGEFVKFSAS